MGKTPFRIALVLGGLGAALLAGCSRGGAGADAERDAARADGAGTVVDAGWETLPPAVRLTDSSADQAAPSFSPDGQRLVYQSNSDGNWELYLYDIAGRRPQRLTDSPEEEQDPSWSPDGRWILCTVHAPGIHGSPPRDILLVGLDGRERRVVARHGADDWFPRFSPDGKSIYFVSDRGDERADVVDEQRQSGLYRYDLASEAIVRLTDSGDVSAPVVLADGSLALRTGPGRFEALAADGSLTPVFDSTDWILGQPVAAADGTWFLVGQQGDEGSRLLRRGPGSSRLQALPLDGREADRYPALSPDGSRLAFAGLLSGQWDLYLRDLPAARTSGR